MALTSLGTFLFLTFIIKIQSQKNVTLVITQTKFYKDVELVVT